MYANFNNYILKLKSTLPLSQQYIKNHSQNTPKENKKHEIIGCLNKYTLTSGGKTRKRARWRRTRKRGKTVADVK